MLLLSALFAFKLFDSILSYSLIVFIFSTYYSIQLCLLLNYLTLISAFIVLSSVVFASLSLQLIFCNHLAISVVFKVSISVNLQGKLSCVLLCLSLAKLSAFPELSAEYT